MTYTFLEMSDPILETLYAREFMLGTQHVAEEDKENIQIKNEFRVFRDYLGLINLIQPENFSTGKSSIHSSLNGSERFLDDDYPIKTSNRKRLDSIDSDKSEASLGSRGEGEIGIIFDAINSQEFRSFKPSIIGDAFARAEILSNKAGVKLAKKTATALLPSEKQRGSQRQVCVFCRNNGESKEFYSGHTLKDAEGNTSCPILRAYTCPLCKACGDKSHTIKYCPKYTPKPKDRLLSV